MDERLALGLGYLGIAGALLTIRATGGGLGPTSLAEYGPLQPVPNGGTLRDLSLPSVPMGSIHLGDVLPVPTPQAFYEGGDLDVFSYARIIQKRGSTWVTVAGSGVAKVALPTRSLQVAPNVYRLVSAGQPEPTGCPPGFLCCFPWPGPYVPPSPDPRATAGQPGYIVTPICGAPPQPGQADLLIEVYVRTLANDVDGFASPTCNRRLPVARMAYQAAVQYQL